MPLIDLTVRYSELATLAECQLKYLLNYAEGLSGETSRRLVLGSAYHALMQGHYESFRRSDADGAPRDLEAARRTAGIRLNEYKKGEGFKELDDEMLATLRWAYAGYVEKYGTEEEFDEFRVIDEKRVVPIVTYGGYRVKLQCTADLIAHHRAWDRWLLLDHKTASGRDASKDATKKENQLDPQRALYAASYSRQGPIKGRIPIFGASHNVIRVDQLKRPMTTEERFGRNTVYYGAKELDAVWVEAVNLAKTAVDIRRGKGRIYSNPQPDTCQWKCQFKEVHLTSRATGRDPVAVALDYGFVRGGGRQLATAAVVEDSVA